MAIFVSRTFHRPSTETEWYQPSKDFVQYRRDKFFKTGKILKVESVESEDKLSMVVMTVFDSEDSIVAYDEDDLCATNMILRAEYNDGNNIRADKKVLITR